MELAGSRTFGNATYVLSNRKAAQMTSKASACPSCGAEVTPGQEFCPECGAKLGEQPSPPQPTQTPPPLKQCPQCGAELEPGSMFCTECGYPVMAF